MSMTESALPGSMVHGPDSGVNDPLLDDAELTVKAPFPVLFTRINWSNVWSECITGKVSVSCDSVISAICPYPERFIVTDSLSGSLFVSVTVSAIRKAVVGVKVNTNESVENGSTVKGNVDPIEKSEGFSLKLAALMIKGYPPVLEIDA